VPQNRPVDTQSGAVPGASFHIDPALKEFVESGVAVLVATGDKERRPHVTYGWGPRVHADGSTVDVFVDSVRADQTLANLRANGRIAMTVAHPVYVRSVQFKGRFQGIGEGTSEDSAWVQRHRDAFLVSTSLIGDPPEVIRRLWTEDVVRLSFVVERAFDQTPGPEAGKPL
jgi:hypothetical protein